MSREPVSGDLGALCIGILIGAACMVLWYVLGRIAGVL
jgi:hypothetical protein